MSPKSKNTRKNTRILVDKNPKVIKRNITRITRTNSSNIQLPSNENYMSRPTQMKIYKFTTTGKFTNDDIKDLTKQLYTEEFKQNMDNNIRLRIDLDIYYNHTHFSQDNFFVKNYNILEPVAFNVSPEKKFYSDDGEDFDDLRIDTFYLQVYQTKRPRGNGKNGDSFCFWKCIKDYINPIYRGDYTKLISYINDQITKQQQEGFNNLELLDKNGTVYIDDLPTIEYYTDISFTVSGDETYRADRIEDISQRKQRHIFLTLKKNHFTLDKTEELKEKLKENVNKSIKRKFDETLISPKYVIAKEYINPNNEYEDDILVVYRYNIEFENFEYLPNPDPSILSDGQSISLFMSKVRQFMNDTKNKMNSFECFIQFIYCIRQIHDHNKFFNLFQFKNIAHFVRHHIHNYLKTINTDALLEPITKEEYDILQLTSGQLVKTDKNIDSSNMFHYDQTSSYPYMLIRNELDIKNESSDNKYNNFLFDPNDYFKLFKRKQLDLLYIPLKQCKYYEYPDLQKYIVQDIKKYDLRYGIYNVEITIHKDSPYAKFFKVNAYNQYTHWDLYIAYAIGADFKVLSNRILMWRKQVCDKKTKKKTNPNELMESYKIFSNYINQLFLIRKILDDNVLIKKLLSTIHGSLIQTHNTKKSIKKTKYDEETDTLFCDFDTNDTNKLYFDRLLLNINKEETKFRFTNDDFYLSPLARLRPFLYAYQRYFFFFCVFKPLTDKGYKIYKIFTDGFYTDKRIPKFDELTERFKDNKQIGLILYDPPKK